MLDFGLEDCDLYISTMSLFKLSASNISSKKSQCRSVKNNHWSNLKNALK